MAEVLETVVANSVLRQNWRCRVPFVRPEVPAASELAVALSGILRSGTLTNGSWVERLERMAAERLGVTECVAVSSCTAGLMLVLRCLDLSGEVIVPSFTFFATAHAVLWNELQPVLVDCRTDTFNIDPQRVREAVTRNTSAIIAVHIFGNPAEVEALESVAGEFGLKLILDAAHGMGSRIGERSVGAGGDAEVFSLSPTKLLVAGEGGLIATRDRRLARRLRAARNYGHSGEYDCEVLGLNARMTEMQAALACAGLEELDKRVSRRNWLASLYESWLSTVPGLSFQRVQPGCLSSRKDFAVVVDEDRFGMSRDEVRAALEEEGVETRCYFYPPLHRQRLYRNCRRGDLTNTDRIGRGVLNLPLYSTLPEETVESIARRILLAPERLLATIRCNGSRRC